MNVLGVSGEHDSGAALVVDGELVAASNEERFNRRKLSTCFPEQSIQSTLAVGGLRPEQIDEVALASYMHIPEHVWDWDQASALQDAIIALLHWTHTERLVFGTDAGVRAVRAVHMALFLVPRILDLRKRLAALGIRAPIRVVDHHVAHLASAYYTSGWDSAVALSVDASGDGLCSRLAICKGPGMELVSSIPFFHSPGLYYASITKILGFKPGREGKVTGLAARGNPAELIDLFRSQIRYLPEKFRFNNFGRYRRPQVEFLTAALAGHSREDIAAGVQTSLEETVCEFVKDAYAKLNVPHSRLCLAGGVFANVRLNQEVAKLPQVGEVFIHPNMGDGGLAAGSALYRHSLRQPEKSQPRRMRHAYLGPSMPHAEIVAALERRAISYRRLDAPELEAARLLAADKCIMWCRGPMEYGPRALCNRSILYEATDPTVNEWLNVLLNRSEFMPFAPVIREEKLAEYFVDHEKVMQALEFMTITLYATERCRAEAPAIVHVDNTARPQVIRRDVQPEMHRLLVEYERLTGRNVLINTSCNMHEEPIVCSAEDAVEAFQRSSLDALVLDGYLIENTEGISASHRGRRTA